MAKRPAFNLPSTDAGASKPKADWVYRSDAKAEEKPVARRAARQAGARSPDIL
jgi:hypothetical protein